MPAHLQLPPRSVPELNVPENKTPHLIEVQQMDAEFNQTVCGRWPATGPLGLGVPKIKALHQKKFGVQHDSLESGAAVIQPPLQLRGIRVYFFFLSFFLSLFSLVGLTRGLPQPVPAALPREFYVSLLAWPRGPVTGPVLCFFAGLAARPWYYWPWRRPLGWLIAIVTCRQYCVIKYMCLLDQRCISCVNPWKSMVLV